LPIRDSSGHLYSTTSKMGRRKTENGQNQKGKRQGRDKRDTCELREGGNKKDQGARFGEENYLPRFEKRKRAKRKEVGGCTTKKGNSRLQSGGGVYRTINFKKGRGRQSGNRERKKQPTTIGSTSVV